MDIRDFEIISWPVGLDHDVDEMDDMDDFHHMKKKDETRGGIHMACKGKKSGSTKKK